MDLRHRSSVYALLAFVVVVIAVTLLPASARAASKLKVVTATTDLAELASEVGGDRVEVESIARGYQDPHFVEAKPSFLLKLRRADLLIVVGLQLEIGWLPPLINQCGNPKVQVNAPGYLDASQFAEILERPTGTVTRAMGDVHPYGNPHFWLDPENGRRIAQGIEQKLAEMRPEDAAYFEQRFQGFSQRVQGAEKRWEAQMQPYRGRKVVTYHRSWPNFLKRFGLVSVGEIEPRPGIPPSPRHTVEVIQLMRRDNVKVILVEPYFDLKTPKSIARETGSQVLVMLPSVGGEKEVTDYFKLFDYDIGLLTRAFQATQ
jgi:zinc/manganese transport system substrate-binding protein